MDNGQGGGSEYPKKDDFIYEQPQVHFNTSLKLYNFIYIIAFIITD